MGTLMAEFYLKKQIFCIEIEMQWNSILFVLCL